MNLGKLPVWVGKSLLVLFLFSFFTGKVALAQTLGSVQMGQSRETLAEAIDFGEFRKDIASSANMTKEDEYYFFEGYVLEYFSDDKAAVLQNVLKGSLNAANLPAYFVGLKAKYLQRYNDYLAIKEDFVKHQQGAFSTNSKKGARLETVNGPCTNMGFETGNFSGWEGEMQDRNTSGTNANPIPGPLQTGFLQHCVMSPNMRDPYVAALSVVPPGKAHSVRLGNITPGGHVARMRQTFMVDSSNFIFT